MNAGKSWGPPLAQLHWLSAALPHPTSTPVAGQASMMGPAGVCGEWAGTLLWDPDGISQSCISSLQSKLMDSELKGS